MITKVCIDNFRCFSSFEIELGPLQLLVGENGSGKSTLLDVLSRIRDVLAGASIGECFFAGDRTAWDTRTAQDFAVEMSLGDEQFRYELRVHESPSAPGQQVVGRERLMWNSMLFHRFEEGQVQLYRAVGSDIVADASFPFDSTRSFIPLLPERPDNQPLCRFRQAVYQWLTVRLSPPQTEASSKEESRTILPDGRNFSSWYRYLAQAHPDVTAAVTRSLQGVIEGMEYPRFEGTAEAKWLQVPIAGHLIPFYRLSDGQRALIVLYSVLHASRRLGYSLHIDEPDNYVSLREIQPWLNDLQELCGEGGRQAILISHHPEIVNPLAKDHGILFSRPDNGPVRARKGYPVVEGLTPAETMARGWGDE